MSSDNELKLDSADYFSRPSERYGVEVLAEDVVPLIRRIASNNGIPSSREELDGLKEALLDKDLNPEVRRYAISTLLATPTWTLTYSLRSDFVLTPAELTSSVQDPPKDKSKAWTAAQAAIARMREKYSSDLSRGKGIVPGITKHTVPALFGHRLLFLLVASLSGAFNALSLLRESENTALFSKRGFSEKHIQESYDVMIKLVRLCLRNFDIEVGLESVVAHGAPRRNAALIGCDVHPILVGKRDVEQQPSRLIWDKTVNLDATVNLYGMAEKAIVRAANVMGAYWSSDPQTKRFLNDDIAYIRSNPPSCRDVFVDYDHFHRHAALELFLRLLDEQLGFGDIVGSPADQTAFIKRSIDRLAAFPTGVISG